MPLILCFIIATGSTEFVVYGGREEEPSKIDVWKIGSKRQQKATMFACTTGMTQALHLHGVDMLHLSKGLSQGLYSFMDHSVLLEAKTRPKSLGLCQPN